MAGMAADPTTATTANAIWRARVAASAGKTAFRTKQAGAWTAMTFREADDGARQLAAGLVAAGVAPGDRVALLSQTRIEWMLLDVALGMVGAVSTPIYASNTAEQCSFIVRNCG